MTIQNILGIFLGMIFGLIISILFYDYFYLKEKEKTEKKKTEKENPKKEEIHFLDYQFSQKNYPSDALQNYYITYAPWTNQKMIKNKLTGKAYIVPQTSSPFSELF